MRPDDPNLPNLRIIAAALGGLREQMVFVGGAVAGLLVSDPLADPVRATVDVDAVVQATLGRFHRIEEDVAACGFVRDIQSGVICRWVHRDSGIVFDLMPVRYATSYEFVPGPDCPAPLRIGDPRFHDCYRAVGDFPEVNVGPKWFATRILTAFGAGLAPIL